jgi:hypothetical protein
MVNAQTRRRVATGIALTGVVAGIAYSVVSIERDKVAKRELETAEAAARAAANAVSVLPPGTENAWLAYVDRRVAATMTPQGSTVRVVGVVGDPDDPLSYRSVTAIISSNKPYQVSCGSVSKSRFYIGPSGSSGIDVKFGAGKDATTVEILDGGSDRSAEKAPQLGVARTSVAAKTLTETLCRRVADDVNAIMAPSTGTPAQR